MFGGHWKTHTESDESWSNLLASALMGQSGVINAKFCIFGLIFLSLLLFTGFKCIRR